MKLLELAETVISEKNKPLTPYEIWHLATEKGYDKKLRGNSQRPANTLYGAIWMDYKNNPRTRFVKIGERPARYYLKGMKINPPVEGVEGQEEPDETTTEGYDFLEKDLHPYLAYFASLRFKAHTKTINHLQSPRREFGEWVHPDMVGVYHAFTEWKQPVSEFSAATGNMLVKLYSFELK